MPIDFDRSALDDVTEYLIFDEKNYDEVKRLLHVTSNQREDDMSNRNVVTMPRFLETSLKELISSDPDLVIPSVEHEFKANVPFGMKFLMQMTDDKFEASEAKDLTSIFMDARPHRSKWTDMSKTGQAELYERLEKVLIDLKSYTPHSLPFINKVNRRDVPDYYDVIKNPMDLNTMLKKLKNFAYIGKGDFQADLDLIFDNCHLYNTAEDSPYRVHVKELRERWTVLMKAIPEQSKTNEIIDTNIKSDARSELSKEEPFIPARHPKLMAKRYLHPEFEAFCNSLPDPRYYKFRIPKLCTWTPNTTIITNIKHIRNIQQQSSENISNELNKPWQIPSILTEKLTREVTDKVFTMTLANSGIKIIHKAAMAIWRDALKRYLVDLIMKPLKTLMDNLCLSLGLEEMFAIVLRERTLTTACLKRHLHRQQQYSSDITALVTSFNRQRQRLLEKSQSNEMSSEKVEETVGYTASKRNSHFAFGEDGIGVIGEEDFMTMMDNPFPEDISPPPSHSFQSLKQISMNTDDSNVDDNDNASISSRITHTDEGNDTFEDDILLEDSVDNL